MRHSIAAVLLMAVLVISAAPARADVTLAKTLESRCSNALEARDFDTAVVVCPRAAEEWGVTADEISASEPAHYMALLEKTDMLSNASLASRTQSDQRNSVYYMQRAVDTATAIAGAAQAPSDVRVTARKMKTMCAKMLTYERSHPV